MALVLKRYAVFPTAMAYRFSIATVTVIGIGALVGGAVAIALYLGLSSATVNTRKLLEQQVDSYMDAVERQIADRLDPVLAQADWIAAHVQSGHLDLGDVDKLTSFFLGALAATPQVAGLAVVHPNGLSRRWAREGSKHTTEDWSDRPPIIEWLKAGANAAAPEWREPFWTNTINAYVLLHDIALRRDGQFLGMLGQIIPISDLSSALGDLTHGTPFTPFVLYDRDQVLAHPSLEDQRPGVGEEATLERIATFKDPVLSRIWTPDTERMFMLPNLERTTASTVKLNRTQYAFLYRNIELYGPKPWTIGVYFDVEQSGNQVVRRLLLSSIAGLVVFAVALVAAVLLSRRLSHPVQAIAHVARAVREGRLADATRLPHSLVREFDDANQSINGMVTDLRERETIRETLGRYVPEQVARSLLSAGGKLEVETAEATVLFCDIEQFTMITEQLGPQRIVDLLNAFFSTMVEILERHDGVVTQFQGDAILAVFNIPVSNPHHAESAAKAAQEMLRAVRSQTFEGTQLHIRIGINTGFVVAGAVGAAGRLSYTVHGDAVNLASRLENLNKDYGTRILLSGSTGAKIQNMNLQPRGRIAVRGQSEEVDVFELPAE